MRATGMAVLAFTVLGANAVSLAGDDSVMQVRIDQGLPTGRFPATNQVNCVEPYCIHHSDGSLNAQKSYEALMRSENFDKR